MGPLFNATPSVLETLIWFELDGQDQTRIFQNESRTNQYAGREADRPASLSLVGKSLQIADLIIKHHCGGGAAVCRFTI